MIPRYQLLTLFLIVLIASTATAFAPVTRSVQSVGTPFVTSSTASSPPSTLIARPQEQSSSSSSLPAAWRRQRKSVANIQTASLFGLGAPELIIILIAAAFLLGPQKLAELGKDAGKIAGELKEVPKAFQKGLAEGETQAKAMAAKSSSDVEDAQLEKEKKD
jgi:sec-independent protein translocase protein TatA